MREFAHLSRSDCYAKIRMIETPRLCVKGALLIYWTAAERQTADVARGLGALLSDQAALAAALSDRTLLPAVPPGTPVG
jgi:hypothetical protein